MALIVITGGARSGKSSAAQTLAESRHALGQDVVVAVFASDSDAEMTRRIENHRRNRPVGFSVVEGTGSPAWLTAVPGPSLLVVDCLGTCLGLAMMDTWRETAVHGANMSEAADVPAGFETRFAARRSALVDALAKRMGDTIVVTNEVGLGVVPPYATGRLFRDELGRANASLVGLADASYLAVAGRLLDLSTLPREISWSED